jgi:hypothetical protein
LAKLRFECPTAFSLSSLTSSRGRELGFTGRGVPPLPAAAELMADDDGSTMAAAGAETDIEFSLGGWGPSFEFAFNAENFSDKVLRVQVVASGDVDGARHPVEEGASSTIFFFWFVKPRSICDASAYFVSSSNSSRSYVMVVFRAEENPCILASLVRVHVNSRLAWSVPGSSLVSVWLLSWKKPGIA